MPSYTNDDGESGSDDGEGSATRAGEMKKKAVFDVDSFPFHYTGEVENIMIRDINRKAHDGTICEDAVLFWRKASSHGYDLSHVNYEENCNVPTTHLW